MKPLAVFRCDAGPAIGVGHVMRSLTLADGLVEVGFRCALAVLSGTTQAVPALACSEHEVIELEDDEGATAAMRERWPEGCALLVVDHYGWDRERERECRPWAKRILVIDDLANRPHDADWLLDQTLGRLPVSYEPLVSPGCGLLLGSEYALLRSEFAALRERSLGRRAHLAACGRVLVSMGGGDPDDVTGAVLDALSALRMPLEVDVLMGASAPQLERVAERVAGMASARLHVSTSRVAELMAQADLAVGGAGTTSWERCCLGLPCLILVMAENQRKIADQLAARGAGISLGTPTDSTARKLATALEAAVSEPARLRAMSRAAAAVTDGLGTSRAIACIQGDVRRGDLGRNPASSGHRRRSTAT